MVLKIIGDCGAHIMMPGQRSTSSLQTGLAHEDGLDLAIEWMKYYKFIETI